VGGLMVYGIPDFKIAKSQVARRVDQLRQEGIVFEVNTNIGVNIEFQGIREKFDAVCLAIGAQQPREVPLPGREFGGIVLAVEYLTKANHRQAGRKVDERRDARCKNVVSGAGTGPE